MVVEQALRFMATTPDPFTQRRLLLRRLEILRAAGWVRRWRYAIASQGSSPMYYRLTIDGYRLLKGDPAAKPCGRYSFRRVDPNQHRHAYLQCEFLIALFAAARRHGVLVCDCFPDGSVALDGDDGPHYPDFTFSLRTWNGKQFNFFVELDNETKSIRSFGNRDAIEHTMRRYEEHHYAAGGKFRVLYLCTNSEVRAQHILGTAASVALEPRREIVMATTLSSFVSSKKSLVNRIFQNHRETRSALIPRYHPASRFRVKLPDQVLALNLHPS